MGAPYLAHNDSLKLKVWYMDLYFIMSLWPQRKY